MNANGQAPNYFKDFEELNNFILKEGIGHLLIGHLNLHDDLQS